MSSQTYDTPQIFSGIAACLQLTEAIETCEPTAARGLDARSIIMDFAGEGKLSHTSDAASALPYAPLG